MNKRIAENLVAREKIMQVIKDNPGIHFREIHRATALAMGELEYHLGVLEKMEIVTRTKTNKYSRYYPAYELGTEDKKIMGVLRQEMLRDILLFLISTDNASHGDVAKEFKLIKSTASFYLEKLVKSELVQKRKEGRRVHYSVEEPERVLKLILLYKKGFGDEIAKRVEGLWANL